MPVKEINPISQEQLLAFLLNPNSYPDRPNHVCLKQTHSSRVLLAGPYAYKIKKPVNFGFLDFSTLEKRRYFSEREVLLNRRLCPEVHLGVVPICLYAGTLAFGQGDQIVEYAIKGNLYGLPTCVDQHLAEEDYIVFEAGTYTEAIKLSYRDYERAVKPQVADLAIG